MLAATGAAGKRWIGTEFVIRRDCAVDGGQRRT
jgi:hypothetical protein